MSPVTAPCSRRFTPRCRGNPVPRFWTRSPRTRRALKILSVRFAFLPEEDEAPVHPFSFGNILMETASESVTSRGVGNRDSFYLLEGVTDLLRGLMDLWANPR